MKEQITKLVSQFKLKRNQSGFQQNNPDSNFDFNVNKRRPARQPNTKVVLGIVAVGLLIVAFLVGKLSTQPISGQAGDSKTSDVSAPKATQTINKDFDFSLKDDKGVEVGKLKYTIESAEINDQIILKAQKNYAITGKTFLIINLKITNDNKQTVQINSRDYIRLTANGNDTELLAPDIHNDPVEVQAISTKPTRVGFIISTTDKKLKLKVGEIDGPKTDINLTVQ